MSDTASSISSSTLETCCQKICFLFCPDETNSNRLGNVFEVENRSSVEPIEATDDHIASDGRVMEVLSGHLYHGWLEGYIPSPTGDSLLPGR